MRLLSTAAPSYVGISISNTALCVVALCNQKGSQSNSYQLTHYGLSELSPGEVVDNQIIDTEQMGQTIAQLMQQLQLTATQAATAIPQALTLTKTVQMSAWLLDVEIEAQIYIDADQHIPYPIAEASFDFEVLGPAIADSSDNTEAADVIAGSTELVDVLLVVTLTRDVEQLADALTFGSLNTELVEVDTHAIERAFQFIYWQLPTQVPVVALVDIGHSRTIVYVANQGVFVYQCEQLFGGAQLDERLQSEHQLDDEQIKQIKSDGSIQIAGIKDADIQQHLTDFTQALVSTIKQALHAYFQPQHLASSQSSSSQSAPSQDNATSSAGENDSNQDTDSHIDNSANTDSAPQIEQVILCGGSAAMQQLDVMLQQQLGLPVTIANPFAAMALSPMIDAEQLSKDAPRLMTACGLSMRCYQQAKHTRKRRLWRR